MISEPSRAARRREPPHPPRARQRPSGVDQLAAWQPRPFGDERGQALRLTADLFLIMLDDRSGALRVRAAPVAVAGGLLAELLIAGHVTLTEGRLGRTGTAAPSDPLLSRTLGWIMTEPRQSDPGFWLTFLADLAVDQIASLLAATGWIHLVRTGVIRTRTGYRPVNANEVFWRPTRLVCSLTNQPTPTDLILYALIDAVDFAPEAFRSSGGVPQHLHQWIIGQVAAHPEYAVLINTVRSLAGHAAVTLRH